VASKGRGLTQRAGDVWRAHVIYCEGSTANAPNASRSAALAQHNKRKTIMSEKLLDVLQNLLFEHQKYIHLE